MGERVRGASGFPCGYPTKVRVLPSGCHMPRSARSQGAAKAAPREAVSIAALAAKSARVAANTAPAASQVAADLLTGMVAGEPPRRPSPVLWHTIRSVIAYAPDAAAVEKPLATASPRTRRACKPCATPSAPPRASNRSPCSYSPCRSTPWKPCTASSTNSALRQTAPNRTDAGLTKCADSAE